MFQSMRRVAMIAALFTLLALSLAGCVHVDRSIMLKSDGSGTYMLNLALADQYVNVRGSTLQTQMAACGANAKSQGASFTSYDQGGYTTWSFTWPFSNINKLNDLLRTAPQNCESVGLSNGANFNSTDFYRVTRHTSGFTTSFHITGQMNFMLDSSAANYQAVAQRLQDARESFAITMPGGISSHTGGVVSGDTITYTVHVNEVANIDVTSKSLNTAALYPLIGGFIVVLLLFGALVFVYRRQSARSADDDQSTVEGDAPAQRDGAVEPTPTVPRIDLGPDSGSPSVPDAQNEPNSPMP